MLYYNFEKKNYMCKTAVMGEHKEMFKKMYKRLIRGGGGG